MWPGARGDYVRDGYTVLPKIIDNGTLAHLSGYLDHLLDKFPVRHTACITRHTSHGTRLSTLNLKM